VADLAVWRLDGPLFAGAIHDPIEAWLRCGPSSAWHTVVAGQLVVEAGQLVSSRVEEMLGLHRQVSKRFQPLP
jgi:cytosine/adenosine deaminase-related metal-dependent hydrolase